MVAPFINDLYLTLSNPRLEAYRPQPNGSDMDMIVNYFWNIDLAEALVPCLHAAELALRNSISRTLTAHFGTDMWFYQQGLLEPTQLGQFARALGAVTKLQPPLAGRIVAELNFGFWTSMLSARYDHLWSPHHYRLFYTVFPNAKGVGRKTIAARFMAIKDLRNRVAHYEAVWYKPQLVQEHMEIHEAIEWINPTVGQAIKAVDNFQAVYNGKSQVEAGLMRHLGIP